MGRPRKHGKGLPRRVYVRSGCFYYVTKAGKWVALGKTEAEMYRNLASVLEAGDNGLASLFDRYATDVLPTKAEKTREEQTRQLERLRAAFKPFTHPDQVTSGDVVDYLEGHQSKTGANREIALLSHIFTKAIRWRLAKSNPCLGVERNKESPRRHYVQDWDYWLAYAYARPWMRAAMELARLTGQRQADVLKVRVGDLGPDGVYFRQGKTGTEIVIGWTPALRELVDRLRVREVGSVWLLADGKGQRYTLAAIRVAWQRLMAVCPCERFQFRDIRAKSGSDHKTGKHLGHKDARTLAKHYRLKPATVVGGS